jgi:pyridinium-3,5-bisthiocarboxylic acid mononucleotide nickel chelatase
MGKTVYFDLFAGCSGDMIIAALLDAGLPIKTLTTELARLPISGYEIKHEKVKRGAITATLFNVIVEPHSHQHRSYKDIVSLISKSDLSKNIISNALNIFNNLGKVESAIHGTNLEQVHFHEVGAIDSIVDIVGALIGFEILDITNFYSSAFPITGGKINSQHGILPLPAPAMLALAAQNNAPLSSPSHDGMNGQELVTPTAAAIITSLAEFSYPPINLQKIGYGAGSRNPDSYPNIMRLWIGDLIESRIQKDMVLLETNIDDMNPQVYGYVMEKLFAEGALDVWFTPIQMKKNRPAIMLSVISDANNESKISEILMRETSTLGIRVQPINRHVADREIVDFKSSYGKVKVKIKRFDDGIISVSPEYDECYRIAVKTNIPLRQVYSTIEAEARKLVKNKAT